MWICHKSGCNLFHHYVVITYIYIPILINIIQSDHQMFCFENHLLAYQISEAQAPGQNYSIAKQRHLSLSAAVHVVLVELARAMSCL
jgi:hypothetical protein